MQTCENCKWYIWDIDFGCYFCLNLCGPLGGEEMRPEETCKEWNEKSKKKEYFKEESD